MTEPPADIPADLKFESHSDANGPIEIQQIVNDGQQYARLEFEWTVPADRIVHHQRATVVRHSNQTALADPAGSARICTPNDPELAPAGAAANVGEPIFITATAEADPARTITMAVDWGNGTETVGIPAGEGLATFRFLHTFSAAGTFNVTVTIAGTSASTTLPVTVTAVPVTNSGDCNASTSSTAPFASAGSDGGPSASSTLVGALVAALALWMAVRRDKIRWRIATLGVAAGMTIFTSGAWACTNYMGSMTFTNASGSQTVTGTGFGMNWSGGTPAPVLTASASSSQTISVSSGPGTSGGVTSALPDGTYIVGLARGCMGQGGSPHINCHSIRNVVLPGEYTVSGGAGAGSGGPWTYTSNVGGTSTGKGYDNICVYAGGSLPAPNAAGNAINIKVI